VPYYDIGIKQHTIKVARGMASNNDDGNTLPRGTISEEYSLISSSPRQAEETDIVQQGSCQWNPLSLAAGESYPLIAGRYYQFLVGFKYLKQFILVIWEECLNIWKKKSRFQLMRTG
jgi:hypothetical protein